ncbi:MAG: molybdopterin-guanine dinucleotide biosynthesis protein B [Altererythrobacter sp.]|nr:molybdopterin-guanine dinucleotide biosynthesis protein B [Altererythrobacter sp.]
MKVWGVVGWKNAGKTGLMERLVAEFVRRGISVSTIKHAHHAFDVDQPGKDSHRHRVAGASEVLLSSSGRWALMAELRGSEEPGLEALLAKLTPVDLVLVEGFKSSSHPKVEAHRRETGASLLAPDMPSVRAIASDCGAQHGELKAFELNDTVAIADFIAAELEL